MSLDENNVIVEEGQGMINRSETGVSFNEKAFVKEFSRLKSSLRAAAMGDFNSTLGLKQDFSRIDDLISLLDKEGVMNIGDLMQGRLVNTKDVKIEMLNLFVSAMKKAIKVNLENAEILKMSDPAKTANEDLIFIEKLAFERGINLDKNFFTELRKDVESILNKGYERGKSV